LPLRVISTQGQKGAIILYITVRDISYIQPNADMSNSIQMARTRTIFLFFLFVLGSVIVALPDNNVRLFSVSQDHGPSVLDLIGLIILICPYIYLATHAWKKRQNLKPYQNTTTFKLGSILFVLGLVLVIVSVVADYGNWWLLGAAIMFVYQAIIFYLILK
jgi:uncharacterized membrane protein